MSKLNLSKKERVELKIYGYGWIATWLGAIWIESVRWPLFWTGLLLLGLAMLMVSGASEDEKE